MLAPYDTMPSKKQKQKTIQSTSLSFGGRHLKFKCNNKKISQKFHNIKMCLNHTLEPVPLESASSLQGFLCFLTVKNL